ncbi:hypothetical protein PSYMO_35021, partial [Pseudomonas amygdali pv. mori str. 301020]
PLFSIVQFLLWLTSSSVLLLGALQLVKTIRRRVALEDAF